MSSSPPQVVADRYRLVAPLGQGGMGRVWRATDVVLHRDVAIKELVPPPGLTPAERQEMRERSLREARAIARLNNINVVRVFDVLRTDADPWIVMEYVASRSLQDTLAADGPYNAVRAAEIGLGVLNALRAAHRAGVVHRDVKPGNVLIGADGRVVLTDFGLATVPGDPNVTRTGLVLGSPAYIAPERARDGTAGPAADLWSLGATLYAAVEGASPFARPSAIATLAALATENPPPARNAGPLKPVLNGLLRKDPTHRINAEEAERLLLRAAGRRSKLTFPMSPTMRRPGVGRERPALPGTQPTSAAPVVPGPRPPIAPARPVTPPGRPSISGGRPAAGDSRPPVYVPGKAPVGRPSDTPTKVDGPKIDATRVDAPPVRDDFSRTRDRSPTTPPRDGSRSDLSRTSRGDQFTAADVAAHRRRKAAPEHEKSLADATALLNRIEAPVAEPAVDATRPVAPPVPPVEATTLVSPAAPAADATTLVSPAAPPPDATTVVPPTAPAAEATSVVKPAVPAAEATSVLKSPAPAAEATSVVKSPAPAAEATSVVKPASAADATSVLKAAPAADATSVVKPASAADATSVVKQDGPAADATSVVKQGDPAADGTSVAKPTSPGADTASVEKPTSAALDATSVEKPTGSSEDAASAAKPAIPAADTPLVAKPTSPAESDAEAASAAQPVGEEAASPVGPAGDAPDGGASQATLSGETAKAGSGPTGTAAGKAAERKQGQRKSNRRKTAPAAKAAPAAEPTENKTAAGEAADEQGLAAAASQIGAAEQAKADKTDGTVDKTAGTVSGGTVGTVSDKTDGTVADKTAGRVSGGTDGTVTGKTDGAVDGGTDGAVDGGTDGAVDGGSGGAVDGENAAESPVGAQSAPAEEAGKDGGVGAEANAPNSVMSETGVDASAQADSASAEPEAAGPGGPVAAKPDAGGSAGPEAKPEAAGSGGHEAAKPEAPRSAAAAGLAMPVAARPEAAASARADAVAASARADAAAGSAGADASEPAKAERRAEEPTRSTAGSVRATPVVDRTMRVEVPEDDTDPLVGGVNRPSRPAWRPMEIRPPASTTSGVTVFGTRLTYRQAAIGAGIVLLVLVLIVVLVAQAFGNDNDEAAGPQPGPAATSTTTNPPATSPTAKATTPSSAPPTSAVPSAVALPDGWELYSDSSGFKVPIPKNAQKSRSGSEVEIRWDHRMLLIDQTGDPKSDTLADWQQQEKDRAGRDYQQYQRVKLVRVDGYFEQAADWEFYYTTKTGNRQHAVKRNIVASDKQAYSVSWYVSPEDWDASQSDLKLIYEGFQPKK